ncbi:hypothetical protein PFTANZ_01958 [Plasmodium falciparum Tanzania (2000708)]|uniref:EF-hand domain-containing protein n=2 Tax=Plasmodium falciparum TaxID=5833 RepID=A0A024WA10_PLAFA|nr:hypothetical protein PFTANZ_01958 [Plasmodium falciparum Tanzania (2000708)]ETW43631.1 hypothetical protein PFNF135_01992 [Plasmodium falciparum NF135/5.C10]
MYEHISNSRIEDLFNLKKKNTDHIDKNDLITILKSLGFNISCQIFDDNKNIYNLDELKDFVDKFQKNYYEKEKIENCLNFLNPKKDIIKKNDLKILLCENGNKFTESEFKKFLIDIPVMIYDFPYCL